MQWRLDAHAATQVAARTPTPLEAGIPVPPPVDTPPVPVPEFGAQVPLDSLDNVEVEVVRCRQVLVSDPERAALLARLLERGVRFDAATRKLEIVDLVDTVREYALEDLDAELRSQLAVLADSAWSGPRAWRGRSAFVQLLERASRPRSSIPRLGEGLGDSERQRLARLQRLQVRDVRTQQTLDPGVEPAAVVEQQRPEYPPAATGSGRVVVIVEVGRLSQVVDVKVESSTDPVFESAAIAAARASRYRAAKRPPGVAEPGSVRMTYEFTAPEPADSQSQDP